MKKIHIKVADVQRYSINMIDKAFKEFHISDDSLQVVPFQLQYLATDAAQFRKEQEFYFL